MYGCGKTHAIDMNGTQKQTTDTMKQVTNNTDNSTSATLAPSAFSLWGTCSDMPYLISTNGICIPSGVTGCGSNYLAAQQSSGQNAIGMQFYGCFKGGNNAPDASNEMAVFLCTDVTNWNGYEIGFVMTLNDNTLKCYVQGNGVYNYYTLNSLINEPNGYHTFKCQVESADHSKVDFYIDSNMVWTLQNSDVDYWNNDYYFVGTTHRTSDNWNATGQQIEMYDMTAFFKK